MAKHGNRILKKVYLTPEEDRLYSERSKRFGGFSALVRTALLYQDDVSFSDKIQMMNELSVLIKKRQAQMAGIGNNLNQIAHALNTFVLEGKINPNLVNSHVVPAIQQVHLLYGTIVRDQTRIKKLLFS